MDVVAVRTGNRVVFDAARFAEAMSFARQHMSGPDVDHLEAMLLACLQPEVFIATPTDKIRQRIEDEIRKPRPPGGTAP
jgi:hypothetical protein